MSAPSRLSPRTMAPRLRTLAASSWRTWRAACISSVPGPATCALA
ncbi:hypothetical protein WJ970_10885 [Achromobacter xylosoxidans]